MQSAHLWLGGDVASDQLRREELRTDWRSLVVKKTPKGEWMLPLSGPGRKFHHKFLEIHPQLLRRHSSPYSRYDSSRLLALGAPLKEFYVRNYAQTP